jgi:hypothetical protein
MGILKKFKDGVSNAFNRVSRTVKTAAAAVTVGVVSASSSFASGGGAPLDVSGTGTTIAGYIATAAGAGLAIMAALYGVRVIIRAFKSVK